MLETDSANPQDKSLDEEESVRRRTILHLRAHEEQRRYESRTIRQTVVILDRIRYINHLKENTEADEDLKELIVALLQVAELIETDWQTSETNGKNHSSIV